MFKLYFYTRGNVYIKKKEKYTIIIIDVGMYVRWLTKPGLVDVNLKYS